MGYGDDGMDRRHFLKLSGATLAGAAGCLNGNDTETETPTETPTETTTPTETPTPTPGPGEQLLQQNVENRREILSYIPQQQNIHGTIYQDMNTQRELAQKNNLGTSISWNGLESLELHGDDMKWHSVYMPGTGGRVIIRRYPGANSEEVEEIAREENEVVHEYRSQEMFRREFGDFWFYDADEDLYVQTSSIDRADETPAEIIVDALEGDHPTLDEQVTEDSYQEFPWYDSEPFNNEILLSTGFGITLPKSIFTNSTSSDIRNDTIKETVNAFSYNHEEEQVYDRIWGLHEDGTVEHLEGYDRERELEESLHME